MALRTGAIRFFTSTGSTGSARVQVYCHVKPGVSVAREGILAVTDERVKIGVCVPAREGEANRAVINILSRMLGMPKSDFEIAKGSKSREKLVHVDIRTKAAPEQKVAWLREVLEGNVIRRGRDHLKEGGFKT